MTRPDWQPFGTTPLEPPPHSGLWVCACGNVIRQRQDMRKRYRQMKTCHECCAKQAAAGEGAR